jgi:hypothetical protein
MGQIGDFTKLGPFCQYFTIWDDILTKWDVHKQDKRP